MTPAHLHLMLNHIPILGPLLVLALLAWGVARSDWSYSRIALILLVIIGMVSIPVYVSGEPAEHALEDIRSLPEATVEAHEEAAVWAFAGLEALAVFAGVVLWRGRRGQVPSRAMLMAIVAATVIVTAVTIRTAYLGGQITHTELAPRPAASSPSR
jgi:hypothetical protein